MKIPSKASICCIYGGKILLPCCGMYSYQIKCVLIAHEISQVSDASLRSTVGTFLFKDPTPSLAPMYSITSC